MLLQCDGVLSWPVHGTWVSDKKLVAGERVDLTEGDILRVGVSSRAYKLHWVPLSQAYDLEQSFVSASDVSLVEGKEEETSAAGEGNVMEACQVWTLAPSNHLPCMSLC